MLETCEKFSDSREKTIDESAADMGVDDVGILVKTEGITRDNGDSVVGALEDTTRDRGVDLVTTDHAESAVAVEEWGATKLKLTPRLLKVIGDDCAELE